MNKYDMIREFAEKYCNDQLNDIKKQATERKQVLKKLGFIFLELERLKAELLPVKVGQRSDLKAGIYNAYENDSFFAYCESEQIDLDYIESIKTIEKRSKFIYDDKKLTPTNYVKKNEELLPFEFRKSFCILKTKKIHDLSIETLAGFIYGQILLIADLEAEILDIINSNQLFKDELEELKLLMERKIKWDQPLNEFAYIMDKLLYSGYIDPTGIDSFPKKAALFHPHFYIKGKGGEEASERSLDDAFYNLTKSSLKTDRLEKIKRVFY